MTKKKSRPHTTLNVSGIIQFFGGRQELSHDLEHYDISTVTPHAIAKWVVRKQIPAASLMALDTLANMKRKQFRLADFMQRPGAKKKAA